MGPPPSNEPPMNRPLPARPSMDGPTLPPRPSSTNPFARDPAPSTVSSIGGLPPIPSQTRPDPSDNDMVEVAIPEEQEVTMENKEEDPEYVEVQLNDTANVADSGGSSLSP